MGQVVDRVFEAVDSREQLQIGVVNAAKVVNMRRNPELGESVLASDVIYADGMSVVWASRLLRRPLPERIAGIDLMHEILRAGSKRGLRVFCLGAKQEVLNKVVTEFDRLYTGAKVVGAHNGYFGLEDEERIAHEIRDARPDVLFVAITSPKKEQFMARWADVMNVPVVHGVGGSFDVVAGLVERAPESWQKFGFEWLYRVVQEPRRLWKRYLVTNVLFLGMTIRECFHRDRTV
jgi:N-acetylglucosaminyldiphosphoundecaprenol N-acetyl-beta-D-mannosaminyltransferase